LLSINIYWCKTIHSAAIVLYEDGGNRLLLNVRKFVTSYAAAQHRSSHFSEIKIEAPFRNVDKLQI